jgi:hypothetical protein
MEDPRQYPWPRPAGSFLLDPGSDDPRGLSPDALAALVAGRVPLLAVGSNAAPTRLADKLWGAGCRNPVAVVAVEVADHDAVFASRRAAYGAVPATLEASPGTRLRTHLLYVDPDQREAIDRTEGIGSGVYTVVELAPATIAAIDLDLVVGRPVLAYRDVAGPLRIGGEPRALAALPASRRRWPAWSELDVLGWIATTIGSSIDEVVDGSAGLQTDELLARRAPPDAVQQ